MAAKFHVSPALPRGLLFAGVVAALAAAALSLSGARAQTPVMTAVSKVSGAGPRYLPLYTTLRRGMTWINVPTKTFHRRQAEQGEDLTRTVLDVFERQCLEAFKRKRSPTLTMPVVVLDPVLPRGPGGGLLVTRRNFFCVPKAADGDAIFAAMQGLPSTFDQHGLYIARAPFACGGLVSVGAADRPAVDAGLIGDFSMSDGEYVAPMHCWASAQDGDYARVLKGVETLLQGEGLKVARNAAVSDGDWVRQAAFEITFPDGVVTVLVSGRARSGLAVGPNVEVNVLPVRFTALPASPAGLGLAPRPSAH